MEWSRINTHYSNTHSVWTDATSIVTHHKRIVRLVWTMKVFPSYAAKPVKQQFSFCSPKSAILPSLIGNFDDPLLNRREFSGTTFFSAWYAVASCKKKDVMGKITQQ